MWKVLELYNIHFLVFLSHINLIPANKLICCHSKHVYVPSHPSLIYGKQVEWSNILILFIIQMVMMVIRLRECSFSVTSLWPWNKLFSIINHFCYTPTCFQRVEPSGTVFCFEITAAGDFAAYPSSSESWMMRLTAMCWAQVMTPGESTHQSRCWFLAFRLHVLSTVLQSFIHLCCVGCSLWTPTHKHLVFAFSFCFCQTWNYK